MLGEVLALCSAFTWASAVILFKRSEAVSPLGLNLFKNSVSFTLLVPTLLVLGQTIDWQRPGEEWLRLALSGVVGIAVSDTLFFAALRRLGPGTLAVVDCSYAPFIVTLAVLFLGESTGAGFLLGAALVVGGILTVTTERAPGQPLTVANARPSGWWMGVVFGVLGSSSAPSRTASYVDHRGVGISMTRTYQAARWLASKLGSRQTVVSVPAPMLFS